LEKENYQNYNITRHGLTPTTRFFTTKGTKRNEKILKVVALTDEVACEKFVMGLSIVKNKMGRVGRARRSRPNIAVRFPDKKPRHKSFSKMRKSLKKRNLRIRFQGKIFLEKQGFWR